MNNIRYPKLALFGYVHGKIARGRPKKRWLDTVKTDYMQLGLHLHETAELAQDRSREMQKSHSKLSKAACARHNVATVISQVSEYMCCV